MTQDELLRIMISDEEYESAKEYTKRSMSCLRVYSIQQIIKEYETYSNGQYLPAIPRTTMHDIPSKSQKTHSLFGQVQQIIFQDYCALHRTLPLENNQFKPPKLILVDNIQLHIQKFISGNTFSTVLGTLQDKTGTIDCIITNKDYCELATSLNQYFGANREWNIINHAKYDIIAQALPLSYKTKTEKILEDTPLLRIYELDIDSDDFSKRTNKIPITPVTNQV